MTARVPGAVAFALVVSAVLAFCTSAFATENLPAFGKCSALSGGKYANAGCTKIKSGTNADEWAPLTSAVKFTAAKEKETGNAVLETTGGTEVSCEGQTATGEYGPGNQEKNVVYEFTGCKALGADCDGQGQSAGRVNTRKLHGEPGIVTKEAKEEKNIDGIDLRPESGENLAEFACGPALFVVRGGVVARWQADSTGGTTGEETNKMLNKVELEFVSEKPGKQVPSEWLPNGEGVSNGKHEKIIEQLETSLAGGAFEPSAFTLTEIQSTVPKTIKVELRQCEKNIVC